MAWRVKHYTSPNMIEFERSEEKRTRAQQQPQIYVVTVPTQSQAAATSNTPCLDLCSVAYISWKVEWKEFSSRPFDL